MLTKKDYYKTNIALARNNSKMCNFYVKSIQDGLEYIDEYKKLLETTESIGLKQIYSENWMYWMNRTSYYIGEFLEYKKSVKRWKENAAFYIK